MQQNKNQYRVAVLAGFTLLELLIVIAIIGIIASVVLTSTGNARTAREVDAAGREAVGLIREAQQYALTGRQFVSNTDPCQFTISWGTGSSSLTTTYYYKGTNGVCDQSAPVGTSTIRGGVVFGNSGSIAFTLPHGKPTFGTPSMALQLNKGGVRGVACMYQNGLIKSALNTSTCP